MIDVEQRALCAFKHHALARGHSLAQVQGDIGHERLEAHPGLSHIGQHVLPLHLGVADEPIARIHVLANRAHEWSISGRIAQVTHAHTATADLVFIRGANASRRRTDLAFAATGLREDVQFAVIRQDEMRFVRDEEASPHIKAHAGQFINLGKQRAGVHHHAIADEADDAGMQNP